ncbi:unnamed protein product [Meloidogyne enterolobii]|uniref:Uncharacterized protein n=1 Tax=Meloidogyne enterolobii TaxID=390850 RepID=A0ACB0YWD5_MELEN
MLQVRILLVAKHLLNSFHLNEVNKKYLSPFKNPHFKCNIPNLIFLQYTYRYIWRADKCLNSTATFTVGCKWKGKDAIERFNILMKQKFPNDKALFEKLANGHLQ